MKCLCLVLGAAAACLVAVAPADAAKAKKNVHAAGVVQSISEDAITIKGYAEQSDGSAVNFEKKLKLTADTKFVHVKGRGKKAEETAAAKTDVRAGIKVAFEEKDGTAEKIMIEQKRKKNK